MRSLRLEKLECRELLAIDFANNIFIYDHAGNDAVANERGDFVTYANGLVLNRQGQSSQLPSVDENAYAYIRSSLHLSSRGVVTALMEGSLGQIIYRYDTFGTGSNVKPIAIFRAGQVTDLFSRFYNIAANDSGDIAFVARARESQEVGLYFASSMNGFETQLVTSCDLTSIVDLADDGTLLVTNVVSGHFGSADSIKIIGQDRVVTSLVTKGANWQELGVSASISRTGDVIAFYGLPTAQGAELLGVPERRNIFFAMRQAQTWTLEGSILMPGRVTYAVGQDSPMGFLSGLSPYYKVEVSHLRLGENGLAGDTIAVSFLAASSTGGTILGSLGGDTIRPGLRALFTSQISIRRDVLTGELTTEILQLRVAAQVGDVIDGIVIDGLSTNAGVFSFLQTDTRLVGRVLPSILAIGGWGHGNLKNYTFVLSSKQKIDFASPEQFELLAREVAYQNWNIGDKVQTVDFHSNYEVSYVLSQPNNGFYVLGLTSPTFGPALVFRGSAQARDFFDDTDPRGVGYGQFAFASAGTLEWVLHQNEPVDLTGHSLGGALAQWFAAYITKLGGEVDNVVTFNSPGISNSRDLYQNLLVYADDFTRSKAVGLLGVQHYVSSGDIVSLAGEQFIDGDVFIVYSDETDSPLALHTLPILVPRTWDQTSGAFRLRPADLTWRSLISSDLFSEPEFEYDRDVDRLITYVVSSLFARAVVDTTNQAASDLLAIPTKLRFRGGVELLRRNSREILAELLTGVVTEKVGYKSIRYLLNLTSSALERLELVVGPPNSTSVNGEELEFRLSTKPSIRGRIDLEFPDAMGGPILSDYIIQANDVSSFGSFTRHAINSEGEFSVLGSFAALTGASSFDFNSGTMSLLGRLSVLNGLIVDPNARGKVNAKGDFAFGNDSAIVNFPNTTLIPSFLRELRLDDGKYLVEFTNDGDYSNDFVSIWGTVDGEVYVFEAFMNGNASLLSPLKIAPTATNQGGGEGPGSFNYVFPDDTMGAIVVAEWPAGVQQPVLQMRSVNGEMIFDTTAGIGSNYIATDLTNANRVVVKFPVNGNAIQVSSSDDRVGLSVFVQRIAEPPQFSTIASEDGVTIVSIDQNPLRHTGWMYRSVGQQSMLPADISVLPNLSLKWNTSGIAAGSYELAVYDRAPGTGRVLSKWLLVDVESPKPKLLQLNVPDSPIAHNAIFEVSASVANSSSFAELQVLLDGRFVAKDIFGWNGWSTKLDAEGLVGIHTLTAALVNSNGVIVDQITTSVFFVGPSYWQNPVNHLDTNYDGFVTAIDALLIINLLNRSNGGGQVTLLESLVEKFTFLDANGDDHYTPLDALLVINRLNNPQAVGGEGERLIESSTDARDLIFAELDVGSVDKHTKKVWAANNKRRYLCPTVGRISFSR